MAIHTQTFIEISNSSPTLTSFNETSNISGYWSDYQETARLDKKTTRTRRLNLQDCFSEQISIKNIFSRKNVI